MKSIHRVILFHKMFNVYIIKKSGVNNVVESNDLDSWRVIEKSENRIGSAMFHCFVFIDAYNFAKVSISRS